MHSRLLDRQTDRRAKQLMRAARNVPPTSEVIRELAELVIKLEDAPVKHGNVVARLTSEQMDGKRIIVEVYEDATFHKFYCFYSQAGKRRSTKKHLRDGNRNEGLALNGAWGLGAIAQKLAKYANPSNPVTGSKIVIYRKRAYKRLLSVSPDQLGMLKTTWKSRIPVARFSPLPGRTPVPVG